MPSPMPDIPAILDAWDALAATIGTNRRSLAAADVIKFTGAEKERLQALLARGGWPDAFASPCALGCVLAIVSRMTPWVDGRALHRAATGRWYVVQGARAA